MDGEKDNNGGKGYGFNLYQADRKTPVPGIKGNLGLVKGRYGYYTNADRDIPGGLALMREEFSTNVASRKANLLNSAAWQLCGEGIVKEVNKEDGIPWAIQVFILTFCLCSCETG